MCFKHILCVREQKALSDRCNFCQAEPQWNGISATEPFLWIGCFQMKIQLLYLSRCYLMWVHSSRAVTAPDLSEYNIQCIQSLWIKMPKFGLRKAGLIWSELCVSLPRLTAGFVFSINLLLTYTFFTLRLTRNTFTLFLFSPRHPTNRTVQFI